MGVCVGVGVEEASEMVEDEESEQPEERDEPEKETFRMWRSRGRRDDLRRWPKLCSTCMLKCVVCCVCVVGRVEVLEVSRDDKPRCEGMDCINKKQTDW